MMMTIARTTVREGMKLLGKENVSNSFVASDRYIRYLYPVALPNQYARRRYILKMANFITYTCNITRPRGQTGCKFWHMCDLAVDFKQFRLDLKMYLFTGHLKR